MTDPDDAYANAAHIPDGDKYPERWAARAAAFRETARAERDLWYGETGRQTYDLFHPDRLSRGLFVFVHGGYWMRFDKSYWSHLAAGPVSRGWTVAMPSYDLCPQVRIADITREVARAIRVIGARVPGPIVLAGHSAGGHLVARMACADLMLPERHRFRRIVPISPLSDLAPLMETAMNETLRIDPEEARAESPVHHARSSVPVRVWVGGDERPAFLDQAHRLAEAWEVPEVVEQGRHHFDVIDGIEDPRSPLFSAIFDG